MSGLTDRITAIAEARRILSVTAAEHGISPIDLLARRNAYSLPRHIAHYLAWRRVSASSSLLGEAFNRDRTSILYGVTRVASAIERDPWLRRRVAEINRVLDSDGRHA